jgi:predicted metal-dependent peptidase
MNMNKEEKEKVLKQLDDAMKALAIQNPLWLPFIVATEIRSVDDDIVAGITPEVNKLIIATNPEVLQKYAPSLRDKVDVLIHEYWHVIMRHCWNQLPEHTIDNIAADCEINQSPFLPKDSRLLKVGFTYKTIGSEPEKSREYYYDLLMKNAIRIKMPEVCNGDCSNCKLNQSSSSSNQGNVSCRQDSNSKQTGKEGSADNKENGSKGEGNEQKETGQKGESNEHKCPIKDWMEHPYWKGASQTSEEVWRPIILEVTEKLAGTIGGEFIEEIKARWQRLPSLKQIIQKMIGHKVIGKLEDLSRTRPNRRFPLLPGEKEKFRAKLAFVVDTSGSMDSRILSQIFSIIRWATRLLDDVPVIQTDTRVTDVSRSSKLRGNIKVKGRGGTVFEEVFRVLEEANVEWVIFFTDLQAYYPKKAPEGMKVVWVTNSKDTRPPFGYEVIRINERGEVIGIDQLQQ